MKKPKKHQQVTREWLEQAIRSYEPVRATATVEQPLFPDGAIEIAREWARRMRARRTP